MSRRLRIAAVIASLQCGGAEKVLSTLCSAWSARHDVTLVTFAAADEVPFFPLSDAVRHRPLGLEGASASIWSGAGNNLRRIAHVRRALDDAQPDVVVAFGDQTNVVTLLASVGRPWPVVVSERVDPRMSPLRWPWDAIRRQAYRRVDALVLVAEDTRAWVPERLQSRVRVIGNPVTLPEVASREPGAGPVRLIAVGRLVPQKGFDVLLDALRSLSEEMPSASWTLTVVGEGPGRRPLQAQAAALGLDDRVEWVGRVADPSVLVRNADVFVLPSRFEGWPNALAEAMAMGRAVVASDCRSGPREMVEDGASGLLVPPEDPTALSGALGRVLTDAALRERLGLAAREAARKWSLDVIAGRWESVFAEVREGGVAHD